MKNIIRSYFTFIFLSAITEGTQDQMAQEKRMLDTEKEERDQSRIGKKKKRKQQTSSEESDEEGSVLVVLLNHHHIITEESVKSKLARLAKKVAAEKKKKDYDKKYAKA